MTTPEKPRPFPARRSALLVGGALLGLLLPLAGCRSGPKHPPVWVTEEVTAPSERILWYCTHQAMVRQGFPIGSGFDPATRTATSGWHNDLHPFGRHGNRQRAVVQYVPLGPRRYRADVRVEQEINEDITRPHDLSFAKWKKSPDDDQRARILLQTIRALLGVELDEVNEPERPFGR